MTPIILFLNTIVTMKNIVKYSEMQSLHIYLDD